MEQKLQKAVKTLANMREVEIPVGRISRLVEKGEVGKLEIYEALEKYGYEWTKNKWQLYEPQWIQNAIKQFEQDLEGEGFHELLIWIPDIEGERLDMFHDYLTNMELFIEGEIKKRSSEKPTVSDIPVTSYDQHLLEQWEAHEYARGLKHAEDFPYVLRNSFFVNLCAYLETDLCEHCSNRVNAPVIKNAVNQLIGSLKNKIPEWQEISRYVDIRNCIVHDGSILGDSRDVSDKSHDRDKRIRKYCETKANIVILGNEIILEKGFCEDALKTIERFLRKVKIVSLDL
jgi:disulfide oxidoreductase YuzD